MANFANRLPRQLPEPEGIIAARRNIHSNEFRKYLENNHPEFKKLDKFITYLDTALENFGKGMSYVQHQYGPINPIICLGDRPGTFMATNDCPQPVDFPDKARIQTVEDGIVTESYEVLCLSDHLDNKGMALELPVSALYAYFQIKDVGYGRMPHEVDGKLTSLYPREILIHSGAHEAYHIYEYTHKADQMAEETKTYNPVAPENDGEYELHPIEIRANKAGAEALAHSRRRTR